MDIQIKVTVTGLEDFEAHAAKLCATLEEVTRLANSFPVVTVTSSHPDGRRIGGYAIHPSLTAVDKARAQANDKVLAAFERCPSWKHGPGERSRDNIPDPDSEDFREWLEAAQARAAGASPYELPATGQ